MPISCFLRPYICSWRAGLPKNSRITEEERVLMCKIIVKWSRQSSEKKKKAKKKQRHLGTLGNIPEQSGSIKLIQAHKGMGSRIR